MIYQLVPNIPKFVHNFPSVVTMYIKDYGTGNMRMAFDSESLRNTIAAGNAPGGIVDGVVQVVAQGFVQYFWSGDLWVISDQPDTIVIVAPGLGFFLDRGIVTMPSTDLNEFAENDLSTYPQYTRRNRQ